MPPDKPSKSVRHTSASSPAEWPSETSPAQLSPCENGNFGAMNDAFSNSNSGSNEVTPGTGSGASVEEFEKPRRPKSMLGRQRLNVGRLTKTVQKRRNSLTGSNRHGRSVSSGTGTLDGRVSKSSLYSLSPPGADGGPVPARSPTKAELLHGGEAAGRNTGSESGYELSGGGEMMGAFEGLKWGEYVQFKMPAEGEVRLTSHYITCY